MSIHLRNGYRLAPGTDPFVLLPGLREVLNPVRDALDVALVTHKAIALIDDAVLTGVTPPVSALDDAYAAYRAEQRDMDSRLRGHDPHRFEIVIGLDSDTGRYGVIVYADADVLVDAWEALPCVEPYGYWTSSDRPEDVTPDDWDARAAFWQRLMPRWLPADRMLTWCLRTPYETRFDDLLTTEDGAPSSLVCDAVASMEDRAGRFARRVALSLLEPDATFADAVTVMEPGVLPAEVLQLAERSLVSVDGEIVAGVRPVGLAERAEQLAELRAAVGAAVAGLRRPVMGSSG